MHSFNISSDEHTQRTLLESDTKKITLSDEDHTTIALSKEIHSRAVRPVLLCSDSRFGSVNLQTRIYQTKYKILVFTKSVSSILSAQLTEAMQALHRGLDVFDCEGNRITTLYTKEQSKKTLSCRTTTFLRTIGFLFSPAK